MDLNERTVVRAVCLSLAFAGGAAMADFAGGAALTQTGLASVYSDALNGRSTASGERYDRGALTAAHPTWPLGAEVKVTRLDNGKSVRVRINDRGPHVQGRVIDLSSGAAAALGMHAGVARVKLEMLGQNADAEANVRAARRRP
jgi:rare lipoprotein A